MTSFDFDYRQQKMLLVFTCIRQIKRKTHRLGIHTHHWRLEQMLTQSATAQFFSQEQWLLGWKKWEFGQAE